MQHHWPRESLDIWMKNACATVEWHADTSIPITHAHPLRCPNTSYITSLRSGWFDYAAQELKNQPFTAFGIHLAGEAARHLGLDALALVGNFPISTNTWSSRSQDVLITACLDTIRKHPKHFVGVRNLLIERNISLIDTLRALGFKALPARLVYEFDLRQGLASKPSHLMRDRNALAKSNLELHIVHQISNIEALRMRDLYQAIYIKKHSALNAQYTTQFFSDMVQAQVMQSLLLKNEQGHIVAFAMLHQIDETLTVPALGYDMHIGIEGLYRLLFAAIHGYAQTHRLLLNYSSGAGDFKRKRGGIPRIEYTLLHGPSPRTKKILSWLEKKSQCIQVRDLIKLGA